jgi:hypothetical protein
MVVEDLQWPVVFLMVATAVALVYYFAPDAEQDWVWITPGSGAGDNALGGGIRSGSAYTSPISPAYNETYGAIGGVMVAAALVLRFGIALLIGGGAQCRDRARVALRQGRRRRSAGRRKGKSVSAGASASMRNAGARASSTCPLSGRGQLRSGSTAAEPEKCGSAIS